MCFFSNKNDIDEPKLLTGGVYMALNYFIKDKENEMKEYYVGKSEKIIIKMYFNKYLMIIHIKNSNI